MAGESDIRAMLQERIKKWYNGDQDYTQGITIYAAAGGDVHLINLMKQGPTDFSRRRLREELLRIYDLDSAEIRSQPAEREFFSGPVAPLPLAATDPVLEELYHQKVALHKEKDHLRAKLENFPDDQQRGAAAHRILQLRDAITAIWEKEAAYKTHGKLPEDDPGVTDPGMLQLRLERVGGYVRKYRGLVKKHPGHQAYHAKLDEYLGLYRILKEKVKQYKAKVHGHSAQ